VEHPETRLLLKTQPLKTSILFSLNDLVERIGVALKQHRQQKGRHRGHHSGSE